MPIFVTPFAHLDLLRQPDQPHEPLQAFDAADEYLLNHLHGLGLASGARVLLLNDSFGALAASLAGQAQVTSSGDSHLGHLGLQVNLLRNQLPADAVTFVPASAVAQGPFDRVLIRVPKTLALLEEQLIRLHGQLAPGAQVIAAAMVKHLPRAAGDLLEQYIGPVQASLAVKKPAYCSPPRKPSRPPFRPTRAAIAWINLPSSCLTTPICFAAKTWISAPAPFCRTCPNTSVACAWPISVAATAYWGLPTHWAARRPS